VSSSTFSVGDRVVYTDFGTRPGAITKVMKKSHDVLFDTGDTLRVHASDTRLRHETRADVRHREWTAADRAWRSARPQLKHVTGYCQGYSTEVTGATIYGALRTPDELRVAAEELLIFARWLAAKPVRADG
jgi:hypothetical protein